MQKSNWLRIGFVSALALAGATTAIACGGDDEVDPTVDGGPTSSSSGDNDTDGAASSSGNPSSSSGGSSGTLPAVAKLFVAHGFNEIGAVKICFAGSTTAMPEPGAKPQTLSPLPTTADGLLPGTGGVLPSLGARLETLNIRPYLVKTSSLVGPLANVACDELIGEGKPLVDGTDYYTLDGIPAGTLKVEKTYVLIATKKAGSTGDGGAGTEVGAYLKEIDTDTEVAADSVGVQFIHGSQYVAAPVAPFVFRGEVAAEADAGADAGAAAAGKDFLLDAEGVTTVASLGDPTALKSVDPLEPVAQTGFGVRIPALDNLDALHATAAGVVSIQQWSLLSDSTGTQKDEAGASLYFQKGRAFTFIALGDPTPGVPFNPAAKDFRGLHLLVIPNKPVSLGL